MSTVIVDVLVTVGWIVCGCIAFVVLRADWLLVLDMTVGDRIFIVFMSCLGPFGLTTAIGTWLMHREPPARRPHPRMDRVLIKKRGRQ